MRKALRHLVSLVLIATVWVISGCSPQSASDSSSVSPPPTSSTSPIPTQSTAATPRGANSFSGLPRLEGKATVEMAVKGGLVTIELDGTNAPITAGNFVDLVQRGVYNGLVFHRVVRKPEPFVVQGGDPQSKDPNTPSELLGTGSFIDPKTSQARYIPLEIKPEGSKTPVYSQPLGEAGITEAPKLKHKRGAVAMARATFPDSASSQFYIALADLPALDGGYAVFGSVTQGMDIVDKIQQGDRIESMKVTKGAENLKTDAKS